MIASRRLYVTADHRTVVLEDDPDAAFLLCAAGQELPKGLPDDPGVGDPPQFPPLDDDSVDEPEPEPAAPVEPKKRAVRHAAKPKKRAVRHAAKPEE